MSESTLDDTAKQRVIEALKRHAQELLARSQQNVASEQAAATVDQDASFSVDDLSQSDEAGDLSGLFEGATAHQQAALDHIESLDFGPKTEVAPGAVVGFGGDRYVVGVVADSFTSDGTDYEGISTDSPIYAQIAGLRLGDGFTWQGNARSIELLA